MAKSIDLNDYVSFDCGILPMEKSVRNLNLTDDELDSIFVKRYKAWVECIDGYGSNDKYQYGGVLTPWESYSERHRTWLLYIDARDFITNKLELITIN